MWQELSNDPLRDGWNSSLKKRLINDRADAGDKINYTLTATNDGNLTLHHVTLVDGKLGTLVCTPVQPATLAPLASMSCTGSYTLTQADIEAGKVDNTATSDSDETSPSDTKKTVSIEQSPVIGIAKRVLAAPVYVSTGTWDVTFEMLVKNHGNVALTSVQVADDLSAAFPVPTTFTVRSVSSSTFTVNWHTPAQLMDFNGSSITNLLTGVDTLAVGAQGTIRVVVRVVPASAGPFKNTAIASGTPPTAPVVNDISSDGTDPDNTQNCSSGDTCVNHDGDPTNNTKPTLIDFGPHLFDPPFGVKVVDHIKPTLLNWKITWINDSSIVALHVVTHDPIPAGTDYSAIGDPSGYAVPIGAPLGSTNIGVSCKPDVGSITTITYLRQAVDIPVAHHERWDGSGYPRHLVGEQIPLAARIFAVIDVWDALTTCRGYDETSDTYLYRVVVSAVLVTVK